MQGFGKQKPVEMDHRLRFHDKLPQAVILVKSRPWRRLCFLMFAVQNGTCTVFSFITCKKMKYNLSPPPSNQSTVFKLDVNWSRGDIFYIY